jgi:hypothetical protein
MALPPAPKGPLLILATVQEQPSSTVGGAPVDGLSRRVRRSAPEAAMSFANGGILTMAVVGALLVSCATAPPPTRYVRGDRGAPAYPDAAWSAGIEGDVIVEVCPAPAPMRVLSGPPALASATLESLRGWEPPSCSTRRFAFRRHLTQTDLNALTDAPDTVLVTRGLERPRKLHCDPRPSYPPEGYVEGSSKAVATIDEQGRVADVAWRRSIGGSNEKMFGEWLRSCVFAPATLDGVPVPSHYVFAATWDLAGAR